MYQTAGAQATGKGKFPVTVSAYHAKPRKSAQTFREKVEGRLHAAKVNGGASAAQPRGNGIFTVTGRAGARYSVRVFDLETMMCDCKAGQFGNPCWHVAAAYLRLVSENAVLSTVTA